VFSCRSYTYEYYGVINLKTKSLLYGVVVGSIIGSVSALLTAPSSGREIRTELKSTKDEWSILLKELKNNLKGLINSVQHLSKEGREASKGLVADLKNSIEQWKQSTGPNNNNLQNEITNIQQTIEELEKKLNKNQ
jgi:gas vesicle protein